MQAAMVLSNILTLTAPAAHGPSLFGQPLGARDDQSLFFSSFASPPASLRRRLLKIHARFANHTSTAPNSSATAISRKDFPPDFVFGAGCSAFQIEGAPTAGGRGQTIWDSFVHVPGKIADNSLNYPACDFYHLYQDDIKRAKEMGLNVFRFSISWTRIYPYEGGRISHEGIAFYNNVINAIVQAGLTPICTLFHWETPQYLENDPDVLGFRTKNIVPYFVELAETCFKYFGDRVKIWATINEMWTFAVRGYAHGDMAPGRCSHVSGRECLAGDSRTEAYQVGHNLLLAHAKVYRLYQNKYKVHQHGVVGFNPCHFGAKPYSKKMEDKLATERYLEFFSGWQIDPVVFGDYPRSMRDAIGERLPQFTKEEKEELRNSCDFLGHNYYSAYFIRNADVPKDPSLRWYDNDGGNTQKVRNDRGELIGAPTGGDNSWIYNCAAELPPLLEWLEARYGKIPCYIMENGSMDKNPSNAIGFVDDQERITYIRDHLVYLSKAIKDKGINVVGYIYWSFIDVFEWDGGLKPRLGLVHVDFEDGKPPTRTPKSSAMWFREFLTS